MFIRARLIKSVAIVAMWLVGFTLPAAAQRGTVRDPSLHQYVPVPLRDELNYGLASPSSGTMLGLLGRPGELVKDCKTLEVANPQLSSMMVTQRVGQLKVKGMGPAVVALERIMERVQVEQPELFAALGHDGMVCVRRQRTKKGEPPSTSFSNHSWGTAIDLTINGQLDKVGDGMTQRGLLMLYPYFRAERFYWGGAFKGKREDSMHFEASRDLMREWVKATDRK